MRALIAVTIFLALSGGATIAASNTKQTPSDRTIRSSSHSQPPSGEDVFKANCGRCHMPPMSLSPRITGTVLMHMRTRARLSREDEQLLIKYMAP